MTIASWLPDSAQAVSYEIASASDFGTFHPFSMSSSRRSAVLDEALFLLHQKTMEDSSEGGWGSVFSFWTFSSFSLFLWRNPNAMAISSSMEKLCFSFAYQVDNAGIGETPLIPPE